MYYEKPHFIMKSNSQKDPEQFLRIITPNIIREISLRLTGTEDVDYEFVSNEYSNEFLPKGYNKGRLAVLLFKKHVFFITFSEMKISGRNSSWQSVPTAYNLFFSNRYKDKSLHYYFLMKDKKGITAYLSNIYRIMRTMGIQFINSPNDYLVEAPFSTAADLIQFRLSSKGGNKSNNSTYIAQTDYAYEVYAKVYGASKYESSFFIYALRNLIGTDKLIKVYEVMEGNLTELPKPSKEVIANMPNIKVIQSSLQMDIKRFQQKQTLVSPRYVSHLFDKLGDQHCAFCDCRIPRLIQGAHIWNVASIKDDKKMSLEEKIQHATSGDNGLWLCANHHKLFDENIIQLDSSGNIFYASNVPAEYIKFMNEITLYTNLDSAVMTDDFMKYLSRRNTEIAV